MTRSRKGWVIVKRNGGPVCVCEDDSGNIIGTTGYGELYFNRKIAQEHANKLGGLGEGYRVVAGVLTYG